MTAGRSPAERIALGIATLFGAGRAPLVPGTVGTVASIPLVLLAGRLLPAWGFVAVAAGVTLLGVWAAGIAARLFARADPRPVVIDETAGLFWSLVGLPVDATTLVAGALLFRAADVLKPPPARQLERLPGGWGIVADDVAAGLYANLALRVLGLLWSRLGS
ncbi:MAG: phosphatidylglycerophosphatase A [Acidobacteriota bacterium]